MKESVAALLVSVIVASGVHAADQSCTALQALTLKDTRLTATFIEPSPHWRVENDTLTRGAVSVSEPFCRVQGRIETEIEFELWLPPSSRWNGKHLGVGNGGYAGFINYSSLAHGLKRGYATVSTDTGHKGGPTDASWALGHPQRIEGLRRTRSTSDGGRGAGRLSRRTTHDRSDIRISWDVRMAASRG